MFEQRRKYFSILLFICIVQLGSLFLLHVVSDTNYYVENNSRELLSAVGGGDCIAIAQCGGKFAGNCNLGKCECFDRYTGANCQTARKLKLQAFCYSIMMGGWGADRFYLGYTGLGVLKIIIGILPLVLSCVTGFFCKEKTGMCKFLPNLLMVLSIIGVILFWLYDWINILQDKLPDGDGNALFNNFPK